jgi:hypothetical protein
MSYKYKKTNITYWNQSPNIGENTPLCIGYRKHGLPSYILTNGYRCTFNRLANNSPQPYKYTIDKNFGIMSYPKSEKIGDVFCKRISPDGIMNVNVITQIESGFKKTVRLAV